MNILLYLLLCILLMSRLRRSALEHSDESDLQWRAVMASYQAAQEKIDRITAVVQKRIAQLPRGSAELRICREALAKKIRCRSYVYNII